MDSARVLIVDDERHNIKVLTGFLSDEYKVMAAKSGEQALKAVHSPHPPDLILLDIIMPDMDGYEVCRKLKANTQTMHIPVIFVTALDDHNEEAKGFEIGAVDYITKPFTPLIVQARVRTHIQLKRKTDLLSRLASLDGLTEIPNRRRFDDTLKKEFQVSARNKTFLSLILIDIDFFKHYNDYYGHTAGDTCLRQVAKTITNQLNRASDFAARYGGEEFAVILPDTDEDGGRNVAERIRRAVAQLRIPHAVSAADAHVSISLGVASQPPGYESAPLDLIRAADSVLYQAKNRGRNRTVCFSDQQASETVAEMAGQGSSTVSGG